MTFDPRANSAERLVAPAPLPHVSRQALKRVKNPLPIPSTCHYCGGDVALVNNSSIYGRECGKWPFTYICTLCAAYVGLHPSTDIPLGTLASPALRRQRNTSKDLFHQVMKRCEFSRPLAYQWLAKAMGIPVSTCHFGWFDMARCEQAASICRNKLTAPTTAMSAAFHNARGRT
jgi:hypothetical protein